MKGSTKVLLAGGITVAGVLALYEPFALFGIWLVYEGMSYAANLEAASDPLSWERSPGEWIITHISAIGMAFIIVRILLELADKYLSD